MPRVFALSDDKQATITMTITTIVNNRNRAIVTTTIADDYSVDGGDDA